MARHARPKTTSVEPPLKRRANSNENLRNLDKIVARLARGTCRSLLFFSSSAPPSNSGLGNTPGIQAYLFLYFSSLGLLYPGEKLKKVRSFKKLKEFKKLKALMRLAPSTHRCEAQVYVCEKFTSNKPRNSACTSVHRITIIAGQLAGGRKFFFLAPLDLQGGICQLPACGICQVWIPVFAP